MNRFMAFKVFIGKEFHVASGAPKSHVDMCLLYMTHEIIPVAECHVTIHTLHGAMSYFLVVIYITFPHSIIRALITRKFCTS